VVDTIAEQLTAKLPIVHENTSYLTELSKNQGIKWIVVRNIKDRLLAEAASNLDVRARIEENLQSGFILVMPEKPISIQDTPRLGWWRINPVNGTTIGVMDTGFHQETSERVLQEATMLAMREGRFVPPVPGWSFLDPLGISPGGGYRAFVQVFGLPGNVSRGLYIRLVRALLGGF
jgi:hypothetical protein